MKPSYRQLAWNTNASLIVKTDKSENLLVSSYHYHTEVELILLKNSCGIRVIGSHVGNFGFNEVLLIGKNLPHAFLHSQQCISNELNGEPEALVIQFDETFMGEHFLNLPELKAIKKLLTLARSGLLLTEETGKRVIPLMEQMRQVSSLDRILLLLEILRTMVAEDAYEILTDETSVPETYGIGDDRLKKVLDYTIANYDHNIKIEEVADICNMTKESFCRYFKTRTGKTYVDFLTRFRIYKACRLIAANDLSIKEIGYSCGFDSLSNFHQHFKKIVGQSPLEFKQGMIAGSAFAGILPPAI